MGGTPAILKDQKVDLWLVDPQKRCVIHVDLSEATGNVCSAAVQFRLLLSEVPLHLTV